MKEKHNTDKYNFSVEGETEQRYLYWLRDQINNNSKSSFKVAFDVKVQQHPAKYYKSINARTISSLTHICDVESNEKVHTDKFKKILSEMKDAKKYKQLEYELGYSNFAFELWMVLHKMDCNGSLTDRSQYLSYINRAYEEHFEDLHQYKKEDNFKRCLSKLTLEDVKAAIRRADVITESNKLDKKTLIKYKGYSYYRDNPGLSIHEVVKRLLEKYL